MYLPHFLGNTSYSVVLKTEDLFSEEAPEVLKYDITLRPLKREGLYHLVELTKTNVVFNEEEVHDAFNDILLITAQALDKVLLKVDGAGKAVGLGNYQEIKSKWKEVRERTESQYEGEVVTEYLNQMETHLNSEEATWKAVSKSLLYTFLFHGGYRDYGATSSIQEQVLLHSLLPTQTVSLRIKQTLCQDAENQVLRLEVKGEPQDVMLDKETKEGMKAVNSHPSQTALAKMEAFYLFTEKGQLMEGSLSATLTLDPLFYKRIHIELTERK